MRKLPKCHFCYKTLPKFCHQCKMCQKTFCNDHRLPENHGHKINRYWKLHNKRSIHEQQENDNYTTSTNTYVRSKKTKNWSKYIAALIIICIAVSSLYVYAYTDKFNSILNVISKYQNQTLGLDFLNPTEEFPTGQKCSAIKIGGKALFDIKPDQVLELGCQDWCGNRKRDYVSYKCEKDELTCICTSDKPKMDTNTVRSIASKLETQEEKDAKILPNGSWTIWGFLSGTELPGAECQKANASFTDISRGDGWIDFKIVNTESYGSNKNQFVFYEFVSDGSIKTLGKILHIEPGQTEGSHGGLATHWDLSNPFGLPGNKPNVWGNFNLVKVVLTEFKCKTILDTIIV